MRTIVLSRVFLAALPVLVATGVACDGGGPREPSVSAVNAVSSTLSPHAHAGTTSLSTSGDLPVPSTTILADTAGVLAPPGDASFSVDDSGVGHDHIPIWVPPGRAGIQPELSLEYSSTGGDGMLGVGWGLAGLSRITRCKGLRNNGLTAPPVLWGESDSFCLDGEPLVADSDHYFYYRFHDDGSKIWRARNTIDGDADYWQMRTRSGRIVTFGATPDSRLTVSNYLPTGTTKTMTFAVSRVEDRAGNFMTVKYSGVNGGGDIRPVEIDYTGSASDPTTHRSVVFDYDLTSRPDVQQRLFAEQPFTYPERLTAIEMRAPNSLGLTTLRSFNFAYTTSPTTGRTLLSNIAECDGAPPSTIPVTSSTPLCRQASFTYTPGTPLSATNAFGVNAVDTNNQNITDADPIAVEGVPPSIRLLDVDANGLDDLLYVKNDGSEHYALRFSTATGFGPASDTGIPVSVTTITDGTQAATSAPIVLDFNGDGHADVIVNQGTLTAPWAMLYLANNAFGPWQLGGTGYTYPLAPGYTNYQTADLDGNSLPDFVMMDAAGTAWYQRNTDGIFGDLTVPLPMPSASTAAYQGALTNYYLDFNGDGVTDILTRLWTDTSCVGNKVQVNCDCRKMGYGALDLGPNLFPDYAGSPGSSSVGAGGLTVCTGLVQGELTMYHPLFGDFNGDGNVDVIQTDIPIDSTQSPPPMTLALSLGGGDQGFVKQGASGTFTLANGGSDEFTTFDADLDGTTDFIVRDNGGTLPYTVYSWKNKAWTTTVIPLAENAPIHGSSMLAAGDVNGDGLSDLVAWAGQGSDGSGQINAYVRNPARPDQLTGVTGDFGRATSVTYQPWRPAPGEDRSDCRAPLACATRGGALVSEVDVDNGVGGTNAQRHTYASGRADELGWGFLGYKTHTIVDVAGTTTTTTTRQFQFPQAAGPTGFYPYTGLPSEVDSATVYTSNGASVLRTTRASIGYSLMGTGPFLMPATTIESVTTDSNVGTPVAAVSTQRGYNAFGDMVSETVFYPIENESRSKTISYLDDTNDWIMGRPTYVTETSTMGNGATSTRSTAYTYDALGQLAVEIDDPGAANGSGSYDPLPTPQNDGVQTLYTRTVRDANGMPTLVEKADNLATPTQRRGTAFWYDATEGMYVKETMDPMGLVTKSAYEPGLGVLAAQTDANGVVTTYQYDTFGRIRADHPTAGGDRSVAYHAATGGHFGTTEDHRLGQYDTVKTLDSLHREVKTTTTGRADGNAVSTETTYDALGRVLSTTRPHFATATGAATITTYDELGRVTQVTGADGSVQTTGYLGLQATTTNPDGNMSAITNDSLGRPVTSVQATATGPSGLSGHVTTTTLAYGPFDTLATATDTLGNVTLYLYDRRARRTVKKDRDTHSTGYSYDVFGELTDQIEGASLAVVVIGGKTRVLVTGGTDTTTAYDDDGRVTSKTAPDVTQTFTWDTVYPGRLSSSAYSTGTSITYTYDGFGNVKTKKWNGPRGAIGFTYGYDKYNRLSTTTYPSLPAATNQTALVVGNQYSGGDLGGELVAVNDVTVPTSPKAFWKLKSTDASETFPVSDLRNGVETTFAEDPSHPGWLRTITSKAGTTTVEALGYLREGAGRVKERDDTLHKIVETYGYDGLERLTSWGWTGPVGARGVQYVYDDIGNLQQRNVTAGPGTSVTYGYGGSAAFGPHQIASDGAGTAFAFDASGNQLVAPGKSFTYDSLHRVTSYATSSGTCTMTYDGDLARFSRTDPAGHTRFSYSPLFEEFTDPSGLAHYVMTVQAAGRPVAEVEKIANGSTLKTTTVHAILVDALGSIDALVGSNGSTQTIKYDPFGSRATASDPTVPMTTAPDDLRAGFTGHEHDDDVDLIDMVGRVYEPVEQRFLSADPPAPASVVDSQAYNPYSYVRNNPLNATDPTGYLEILLMGLDWRSNDNVLYGSAAWFRGNVSSWISFYGAAPSTVQGPDGRSGPGVVEALPSTVASLDPAVDHDGSPPPTNDELLNGTPEDLVTGEDGSPPVTNEELLAFNRDRGHSATHSQPVHGRVYDDVVTNEPPQRQPGSRKSGESILGPPTERELHGGNPVYHPGHATKFVIEFLAPSITPSQSDTAWEKTYKIFNIITAPVWLPPAVLWPHALDEPIELYGLFYPVGHE